MTKVILITILMIVFFSCSGCIRIDGPYKGKVIDAENNLPIEGAVIHGSWNYRYIGGGTEDYDDREVLTDKNGEFKIAGHGLLIGTILSHVEGMDLTIFKAGYEEWDRNGWQNIKKGNISPGSEVTWEGNKGTFKLNKMTFEQRRKRTVNITGPGTLVKNRLFWIESNKENIEICRDSNTLFTVDEEIKVSAEVDKFCKEFHYKEYIDNRIVIPMGGNPPSKYPIHKIE